MPSADASRAGDDGGRGRRRCRCRPVKAHAHGARTDRPTRRCSDALRQARRRARRTISSRRCARRRAQADAQLVEQRDHRRACCADAVERALQRPGVRDVWTPGPHARARRRSWPSASATLQLARRVHRRPTCARCASASGDRARSARPPRSTAPLDRLAAEPSCPSCSGLAGDAIVSGSLATVLPGESLATNALREWRDRLDEAARSRGAQRVDRHVDDPDARRLAETLDELRELRRRLDGSGADLDGPAATVRPGRARPGTPSTTDDPASGAEASTSGSPRGRKVRTPRRERRASGRSRAMPPAGGEGSGEARDSGRRPGTANKVKARARARGERPEARGEGRRARAKGEGRG